MSFVFVTDHRDYLDREFRSRQMRNSSYSQRAFARDLKVSPSSLNDYLNNKLKFSPDRIRELSKKLQLESIQAEHWIDLVEFKFQKSTLQRKILKEKIQNRINEDRNNITSDQFSAVSEWHNMAILELISMNPARYTDPENVAEDLGLKKRVVKESFQLLEKSKMLEGDSQGILRVSDSTFVNNNIPSSAVRQYHFQILRKASKALETQTMDKRYNASVMMGIPRDKIPQVIEDLNVMSMKVLEPYIDSSANEMRTESIPLYCLGIQFFNLTK